MVGVQPSRIDFGLSGQVGGSHLRAFWRTSKTAGGYCILNSAMGMRTEAGVGLRDFARLPAQTARLGSMFGRRQGVSSARNIALGTRV